MTKSFLAFAALLGALIGPAHAAGENAAVKNTAVSKFSDADYALMKARVDEALKAETDGQTLEWKNDQTGASGAVTPLNRLVWNDLQCRRLRIVNTYGEVKGQGVYKFCEKPAGRWKLVGPDGAQR
jgi:surface antigen